MSLSRDLQAAIENIQRNKANALQQIEGLQKQLDELPKRLAENIEGMKLRVSEMDSIIAVAQVALVNADLLSEAQKQAEANSGPLTPAADGGPAAGPTGATDPASSGDAGGPGIPDQQGAAGFDANGSPVGEGEGA